MQDTVADAPPPARSDSKMLAPLEADKGFLLLLGERCQKIVPDAS